MPSKTITTRLMFNSQCSRILHGNPRTYSKDDPRQTLTSSITTRDRSSSPSGDDRMCRNVFNVLITIIDYIKSFFFFISTSLSQTHGTAIRIFPISNRTFTVPIVFVKRPSTSSFVPYPKYFSALYSFQYILTTS